MNRSSRQNTNREITELNDIVGQIGLTDNPELSTPVLQVPIILSNYETFFTKLDHLLRNETSHNNAWKLK